eukprot:SAG11_NODE_1930_length_4048_cov_1.413776_2_plen_121_part_00
MLIFKCVLDDSDADELEVRRIGAKVEVSQIYAAGDACSIGLVESYTHGTGQLSVKIDKPSSITEYFAYRMPASDGNPDPIVWDTSRGASHGVSFEHDGALAVNNGGAGDGGDAAAADTAD